jgi:hypothetical protein
MITSSEANLVGKIKEKPLLQATLRMNHARARLDRTCCRFHAQSIDTLPNQILVAALQQATKHLHKMKLRDHRLFDLTAFSTSALAGVTRRRILPTDFQGLHYGGSFVRTKKPISGHA